MHVRRLRAREFKRFHDLTIDIPGEPDLVVMCGPNGLGKSSVIDAFRMWHWRHGADDAINDELYHRKTGLKTLQRHELVELSFAEGATPDGLKLIYARSAYRHEADFETSSIQRAGELLKAPRARRMIDVETKVSDNYQRIVSAAIDDLFGGKRDKETAEEIRERLIGRTRNALQSLFPDLELQGPGDPVGAGTFYFTKRGQERFHYKNLSGGEKATFDLLLDLVIKTAVYDDSIICIDEPELHLNTRVQAGLLHAMLELMPASSQLWIATHSIGMLRAAQRISAEDASRVAFLDFEGHDFDAPATMTPVTPDRAFWRRTLEVALGDVAGLVAPDCVVLCEGQPHNPQVGRAEFDARCYRRIFGRTRPLTDFVSVGNSQDVQRDRLELGTTIQTLVSGTRVIRVIDRDMRTEAEMADRLKEGVRVLRRRNLEAYLLDDDVLRALCSAVGQPEKKDDLIAARERAVVAALRRGHDKDDWKGAAGEFYNAARNLLALTKAGNTTDRFLSDTMAPLISPDMAVYRELDEDIFG